MKPLIGEIPHYLEFADTRTIVGVPNFWNVVTNLPFLLVAIWGLRAFRSKTAFAQSWERPAYAVVLAGLAATAFGSAYFHWNPTPATLFWDRLPMTLIFMGILAAFLDRPRLLAPLVAAGIASVLWWRWSGDLSAYVLVQYGAALAIILVLLRRPPRYTATGWMWGVVLLYLLAKILELADRPIGRVIATGGHPWKHVSAAAAMACYCFWVLRRWPSYGTDTSKNTVDTVG